MPVSSTRSDLLQKASRPVHPRAERRGAGRRARRSTARASPRAGSASCCRCSSSTRDKARKLGRRLRKVTDAPRHRPRARRAAAPGRRAACVAPQPAVARSDASASASRKTATTRENACRRACPSRECGAWRRSWNASASTCASRKPRRPETAARSWRLAVEARVANRASRLVGGDGRGRRDVSAGASPRRAHRDEEAAVRGRIVDRVGGRRRQRRPACS